MRCYDDLVSQRPSIEDEDLAEVVAERPNDLLSLLFRALFLTHVFALTALSRDYAHLHASIRGVPLFAGEIALVVLGTLLVANAIRRRRILIVPGLLNGALFGYFILGALFAGIGLLRGHGLAVLRDFAVVYYLLFFFLTLAFFALGGRVRDLVTALVSGGLAAALAASLEFVTQPTLTWEHAVPGNVALVAWLAMCWSSIRICVDTRPASRALHAVAVLVCTTAVYLSAYRTMIGVVLVGVLVLAVLGTWSSWRPASAAAALGASWLLVVGLAVVLHTHVTRDSASDLPRHGPTTVVQGAAIVSNRWLGGLALPQATFEAVSGALTDASAMAAKGAGKTSAERTSAERTSADEPATLVLGEFPNNRLLESAGFRHYVWRNALTLIRRAPFVGIGLGTKAPLFPDRFCEFGASPISNCGAAHNSYLTIAMRLGIPMLLFFLAINTAVVVRVLMRLRRAGPAGADVEIPSFLLLALAGFSVYATTSLFLESPYLSTLYWVVLAALAHSTGRAKGTVATVEASA